MSVLTGDLLVFKSSPDTKMLDGGGGTPPALMDTSTSGFDQFTGKVREDSHSDLDTQ